MTCLELKTVLEKVLIVEGEGDVGGGIRQDFAPGARVA
jgi:hypothetical protein